MLAYQYEVVTETLILCELNGSSLGHDYCSTTGLSPSQGMKGMSSTGSHIPRQCFGGSCIHFKTFLSWNDWEAGPFRRARRRGYDEIPRAIGQVHAASQGWSPFVSQVWSALNSPQLKTTISAQHWVVTEAWMLTMSQ